MSFFDEFGPLFHEANATALPVLIDGFMLSRRASGVSKTTLETYQRAFKQLLRSLPPECIKDARQITPVHLQRWAASMISNYADATRDQRIAKIKAFFAWCVAEGFLESDPAAKLKRPRNTWQPEPFSISEIQRILETARQGRHADRDYAMICLLLDAGLRISELCSVPVDAVDLQSGQIRIVGKGNKTRTVVIGERCKMALWRWLMMRPSCDVPSLFVTQNLRAFDRRVASRLVRRIGKRAGVARCYPHRFRHTFAVFYLRGGGDPYSLQYLLGHKDMTVTRMYVKLAAVDVKELYKSPLDRL